MHSINEANADTNMEEAEAEEQEENTEETEKEIDWEVARHIVGKRVTVDLRGHRLKECPQAILSMETLHIYVLVTTN